MCATLVTAFSIPAVWALGYHDHPWRRPELAIAAGLVAVVAAQVVRTAGVRIEPPLDPRASVAAGGMAAIALVAALWWWLTAELAIP